MEGEIGRRTHDELARVCKEQLANLETLWPEIGVESSWELVMAHGPLRCSSMDVFFFMEGGERDVSETR
jgi:hypothetical protein